MNFIEYNMTLEAYILEKYKMNLTECVYKNSEELRTSFKKSN